MYRQSLLLFDVEIMVILRKAEMWAGKVMTLRPGNLQIFWGLFQIVEEIWFIFLLLKSIVDEKIERSFLTVERYYCLFFSQTYICSHMYSIYTYIHLCLLGQYHFSTFFQCPFVGVPLRNVLGAIDMCAHLPTVLSFSHFIILPSEEADSCLLWWAHENMEN